MSIPENSLLFCSMFEGEVLLRLLLLQWGHPFASENEFCSNLLESCAEVLQTSINGEQLIEGLPASQMNLIAASWYVEWNSLQYEDVSAPPNIDRIAWLKGIRHAIPSCFDDSDFLWP